MERVKYLFRIFKVLLARKDSRVETIRLKQPAFADFTYGGVFRELLTNEKFDVDKMNPVESIDFDDLFD